MFRANASPDPVPTYHTLQVELETTAAVRALQARCPHLLDTRVERVAGQFRLIYRLAAPLPQPLPAGPGWRMAGYSPATPLVDSPPRALSSPDFTRLLNSLPQRNAGPSCAVPVALSTVARQAALADPLGDARHFVELLHGGSDGVSEFTCIHPAPQPGQPPVVVLWADISNREQQDRALAQALHLNAQGYHAYLGVCPRRTRKPRGRGTAADAGYVPALWVDLDHTDDSQPLLAMTPPPSLLLRSGGGFHAYWLLDRPLAPSDEVEALLKELARATGGDPQVAEFARLMRLPGTLNLKPGRQDARCEIAGWHPERRYSLDDFREWLAPPCPAHDEAQYAPVWASLLPRALHAGLGPAFRFWTLLHHLHNRQEKRPGWLPLDVGRLAAAAGVTPRAVRGWLAQGDGLFWSFDRQRGRLYLRGQRRVAASLAALAARAGAFDPASSDLYPAQIQLSLLRGGRRTWNAFCAAVFNNWLALRGGHKRVTWAVLEATWHRSRKALEAWIGMAGVEREHNLGRIPLVMAGPDDPAIDTLLEGGWGSNELDTHVWYVIDDGVVYRCWQRGNTYYHNRRRSRLAPTQGQANKLRSAIHQAVGQAAVHTGHGPHGPAQPYGGQGPAAGGCAPTRPATWRTNFEDEARFIEVRRTQARLPLYVQQPDDAHVSRDGRLTRVWRYSPSLAHERLPHRRSKGSRWKAGAFVGYTEENYHHLTGSMERLC